MVDAIDEDEREWKMLDEMKIVCAHVKSEEEKWNDFVVEMSVNKVLKKLTHDNLDTSWTSLNDIITQKPLSSALMSMCHEVQLLLRILLKNCVEKDAGLEMYVFLTLRISLSMLLSSLSCSRWCVRNCVRSMWLYHQLTTSL